jgi:hypothetical protein
MPDIPSFLIVAPSFNSAGWIDKKISRVVSRSTAFRIRYDVQDGVSIDCTHFASGATIVSNWDGFYALQPAHSRWFAMVIRGALLALPLNDGRLVALQPVNLPMMPWRTILLTEVRDLANAEGLVIDVPLKGDPCWHVPSLCTLEIPPKLTRTRILGRRVSKVRGSSTLRTLALLQDRRGPKTESDGNLEDTDAN